MAESLSPNDDTPVSSIYLRAADLRRQRDEAWALLREIEWGAQDRYTRAACPSCQQTRGLGHAKFCRLASVLLEANRV